MKSNISTYTEITKMCNTTTLRRWDRSFITFLTNYVNFSVKNTDFQWKITAWRKLWKKNLLRKIIHVLFCLKRLISEKFPFHPRITHLCSISNRNFAMCKLFPGLYIVYYYSITTVDKLRRISKATFISDGFRTSSLLKKKIL